METLPPATIPDRKWHEIWLDIWMHPGDQAFRDAFKERDHGMGRAFIWLLTTGLIAAVISSAIIPFLRSQISQVPNSFILAFFCEVILAPIFAILGMIITSLIYHVIAMIFGGKGQWGDLVFGLSAVNAPATVISSILVLPVVLFSRLPVLWWLVALLVGILSVVLGVYVIIETVNAIRAAENISVAAAIGTILLPIAVAVILSVCCTVLLVPAYFNTGR
jgi:hypothetical protein